MIWIDHLILAVIVISALLSLWRGLVAEALSLITWIAALWVSILFFREFADFLVDWISTPSVRDVAAFAILFVCVLILGGFLNYLARQLVDKTGLTATDRALGMIFGIGRGIVIITVLVMLADLTSVPEDDWWNESILLTHFEDLAAWFRSILPDDIAERIQYKSLNSFSE